MSQLALSVEVLLRAACAAVEKIREAI